MAKTVEIDEVEYNRQQAIISTLTKVAQHPKGKLLLQKAHKEVDPNAITPDLDRESAENDRVAAVEKKFEEYKAEQEKLRAEAEKKQSLDALNSKIENGLSRLRREHRLTDEGVEAIRKLMEEEGIVNPDTAFAVFEKRQPPPMPAMPHAGSNGPWNFLDVSNDKDDGTRYAKSLLDTHKPGAGGGDVVLDKEIHAALHGLRAPQY